MKVEMLMPQMGESITQATISKWVKQPGEVVKRDEIILNITTDKVDSEIPSPASGILSEILFPEGATVPVKVKIAVIDTEAAASAGSSNAQPAQNKPATAPIEATPAERIIEVTASQVDADITADRFYSPLVRSLASKHGIKLAELDSLPGSGLNGRFTKEDLLVYVENRGRTNVTTVAPIAPAPQPQAAPTATVASTPVSTPAPAAAVKDEIKEVRLNEWLENGTKIVPMDNMRKAISEHMVRSKRTSPHVYSIQEADVTAISKWRAAHKEEFKKKEGFNLSFTPFFMEAAVKALQEYPIVNSSVDGQRVVYKKNVNLGCAVAIGTSGLIVPVIKRAEEKNFVGLARGLNDLALRARNKKLSPDEVMDGSFTITNPGIFGTMIGTPIINQPQAAILCLGAIEKRPVVVEDMIAIRERCYLTLSYDHRIIDGSMGAQFIAYICKYLAEWDLNRSLY